MVLVLLSASVKRCFVSRMRDFLLDGFPKHWALRWKLSLIDANTSCDSFHGMVAKEILVPRSFGTLCPRPEKHGGNTNIAKHLYLNPTTLSCAYLCPIIPSSQPYNPLLCDLCDLNAIIYRLANFYLLCSQMRVDLKKKVIYWLTRWYFCPSWPRLINTVKLFIAYPGKPRGGSENTVLINEVITLVNHPFPQLPLRPKR